MTTTLIIGDVGLLDRARPGEGPRFSGVDLNEFHLTHRRHRGRMEEIRALPED